MKSKFFQYFGQYRWADIFAMIRNSGRDPLVCTDSFQHKLMVITGATSGIGYFTARKYASRGTDLLCINRNAEKSEKLKREIETEFGVSCNYLIADLSSISDIFRVSKQLAELKTDIDVLIHNAGVYLTHREITPEGFEKVFTVHYLSTFVINYVLAQKLKAQQKARIILVGSEGHRFAAWGINLRDLNFEKRRYSGLMSYGTAKTAQLLSMIEFDKFFRNSGVTIITMHPGAVKTKTGQENGRIYRWFKRNFFDKTLKSPEISAEALYYLGVSPEMDNVSCKFFNLTTPEKPAPPAVDNETATELWELSLRLTGLSK